MLSASQLSDGHDVSLTASPNKITPHGIDASGDLLSNRMKDESNNLKEIEPRLDKKIKKDEQTSERIDSTPAQSYLPIEVLRSRKIHKQLQEKKSRWKPTEYELAILKLSFEGNQYPTKQEKEKLLKMLETRSKSKIELNQLARWFQHQRERSSKIGDAQSKKSTYKKFDKEELKYLQDAFNKNTYPKTEEMTEIAKKLNSTLSKIENWYKHNRRSLARKGLFELKNKRYFKKDELEYLQQCFALFPRPTRQKYSEMAKTLDCDDSHIKNWYSNKRKKQKLFLKRANNGQNSDKQVLATNSTVFKQINTPPSNPLFLNLPLSQTRSNANKGSLNLVNDINGTVSVPSSTSPTLPDYADPLNYYNSAQRQSIRPSGLVVQTNPQVMGGQQPYIYNQSQPMNGMYMYPKVTTLMLQPSSPSFPMNNQYVQMPMQAQTKISPLYMNQPQFSLSNAHNSYGGNYSSSGSSNDSNTSHINSSSSSSTHHNSFSSNRSSEQASSIPFKLPEPRFADEVQQAEFSTHNSHDNRDIFALKNTVGSAMNKTREKNEEKKEAHKTKDDLAMNNPQNSGSDSSCSNNNNSASSDSRKNTNNSNNTGKLNQDNITLTGSWSFPVGVQVQSRPMFVPVPQPTYPTTVNGQPQGSCYYSVLYPWQNPMQGYAPTFQNNSYIYNNSTTFSNYPIAYNSQPSINFSPNIMVNRPQNPK